MEIKARHITKEGPVEMTDYDLITLLIHSLLVWGVVDDLQFCYTTGEGHKWIDVSPEQSERLLQSGLIEKLPGEDEGDDPLQWHLSSKGWEYVFSRPKRND